MLSIIRRSVGPNRLAAIGITFLIHVSFLALVLNPRDPHLPTNSASINVALIFEQPVLEPAPTPETPDPVEDPIPEVDQSPTQTGTVPPTPAPVIPIPARPLETPAPVSAQSTSEFPEVDNEFSDDVYVLSPGTQSVLRGIQCPGDPDAFANSGICPQGAGRHSAMVAADETASDFYAIDVGSIRALFGYSPHALSGQDTMDDGTERRSLSNADSMREALPASRADPAFGD